MVASTQYYVIEPSKASFIKGNAMTSKEKAHYEMLQRQLNGGGPVTVLLSGGAHELLIRLFRECLRDNNYEEYRQFVDNLYKDNDTLSPKDDPPASHLATAMSGDLYWSTRAFLIEVYLMQI